MLANPTGPSATSVQSLRTSPSFLATTEAQPTVLSLLGLQWPLDWFPHVCSSFAVFNLAARSILLEHKSCCSSAQNPLITPQHVQTELLESPVGPCAGPLDSAWTSHYTSAGFPPGLEHVRVASQSFCMAVPSAWNIPTADTQFIQVSAKISWHNFHGS